jgi:hypothetical protein
MRIAGLLHDLGKLTVPNSILEKPGPLAPEEQLIIRQHTYFTFMILNQLENFRQVAEWAAWHHETLDGKGYPFKLNEPDISLGARIMAVADIFVALAENRPYRKKLPETTVKKIMQDMADNNKISKRITESLFDNFSEAELVVQTMEAWAMGFSDGIAPPRGAGELPGPGGTPSPDLPSPEGSGGPSPADAAGAPPPVPPSSPHRAGDPAEPAPAETAGTGTG